MLKEYLIKMHFVPAMADDFNTVIEKMYAASEGQNTTNYDNITSIFDISQLRSGIRFQIMPSKDEMLCALENARS